MSNKPPNLNAVSSGLLEHWQETSPRLLGIAQELRAEVEDLRVVLEKIATDYYHDRHAIWAQSVLDRHRSLVAEVPNRESEELREVAQVVLADATAARLRWPSVVRLGELLCKC